ncbi:MAG TPA: adenosylcobinamide-GDP ribazoletransferase, partial [Alphaproteobacteria bacterium]|nr:adenosylcobinamide-GDP ribazoletransferase [Alphaproteobacteria bacterium]
AALRYAPLAGVIIGGVGAAIYALCLWLGLGPLLAAALAVAAMLLTTGALHEDGLSDVADGFGGGRDRDHKLAIMADSRIGTYGTAALILCLLLRIAALVELHDVARVSIALIASASLSRAFMYTGMRLLP